MNAGGDVDSAWNERESKCNAAATEAGGPMTGLPTREQSRMVPEWIWAGLALFPADNARRYSMSIMHRAYHCSMLTRMGEMALSRAWACEGATVVRRQIWTWTAEGNQYVNGTLPLLSIRLDRAPVVLSAT